MEVITFAMNLGELTVLHKLRPFFKDYFMNRTFRRTAFIWNLLQHYICLDCHFWSV